MHMVVVCGRNEPLREKLEEMSITLPTPMTVIGFTDRIPELFRAADLLVTKAGPGALAEANAAKLPVVVYDYVPGQERGNVDFVRANGLGEVALHGNAEVARAGEIGFDPHLRLGFLVIAVDVDEAGIVCGGGEDTVPRGDQAFIGRAGEHDVDRQAPPAPVPSGCKDTPGSSAPAR